MGRKAIVDKRRRAAKSQTAKNGKLAFRLYITPGDASSAVALANLATICREHFGDNYAIEVLDTLKHSRRAEQDGVTATPALIKRAPVPTWTIVGDLSDEALILGEMQQKSAEGGRDDR